MAHFWEQPDVHANVMARFEQAKKRDSKVTVEDAAEAFNRTDDAETLFFRFYDSLSRSYSDRKVKFSDRGLSGQFKSARERYFAAARKFVIIRDRGQSEMWKIHDLEKTRSSEHTTAASVLVRDRLVPSDKLAKRVLHFMAVAEGIDNRVDPDRTARERQAVKNGW